MGSELTGVIYILDEPSIGLHQRDNGKLLATLKRLRDLGNSVIVVEHDEETMEEADWLVDFGPGAGTHGGEVVSQGTPAEVKADPASLTGAYLSGRLEIAIPERRRKGEKGNITIFGASANNLKDIDRQFSARAAHRRDRRLRRREVHPRERHPQARAHAPPLRDPGDARQARAHERRRARRQGHRHQPAAHRPHPALQPRHLHQALRQRARGVRPDTRGPLARLPARAASASTSRADGARPARATA